MVVCQSTIDVLSKHYGVRIMYRKNGPPFVEISQRARTGHAESCEDVGRDIIRAVMINFDAKRILFQDDLQEYSHGDDARDKSARVIQAAFRRFVIAGDPYLAMPPFANVREPCDM